VVMYWATLSLIHQSIIQGPYSLLSSLGRFVLCHGGCADRLWDPVIIVDPGDTEQVTPRKTQSAIILLEAKYHLLFPH